MHFPGGHGGGYASASRSEARARFRRSHAVGQRVRGVLLSWERPGLAWVKLTGCDLLAAVEGDVQPGQALFFRIMQLIPDIVLQQLSPSEAAGAEGSALAAAHQWLASRSALDAHFAPLLAPLAAMAGVDERKAAFFRALAGEPDLLPVWAGFLEHLARVNEHLAAMNGPAGGAVLASAPWLLPVARDMEILSLAADPARQRSLAETICSLSLPRLGRVELRFLGRGAETGFRVFLEHPEHAEAVRKVMAAELAAGLAPAAKPQVLTKAFLGAAQLPSGRSCPLLAYVERGAARPGVLDARV